MKEIRDKCLINKSYKSAKTKPSKKRKALSKHLRNPGAYNMCVPICSNTLRKLRTAHEEFTSELIIRSRAFEF